MQQQLEALKQGYDIVNKHSSDTELSHLQEMKIETDPKLPPLVSKPYALLLNYHKFVKEEIGNLLEAWYIECLVIPYTEPIIVTPCKVNQEPHWWKQND